MKIFLETTIPSYITARPSRDILRFSRQQLTREWWETRRQSHGLFTSQLVLDEVAVGDSAMAAERLTVLSQAVLLARQLADRSRSRAPTDHASHDNAHTSG